MLIFNINPTDPYFEAFVDIDDETFVLEIGHDFRSDRWFMNLRADDRTMLAAGVRLIPGADLLAGFSDPRLPAGRFEVATNKGDRVPVNFDDLGDTASLFYLDVGDIAGQASLFALGDPVPVRVRAS